MIFDRRPRPPTPVPTLWARLRGRGRTPHRHSARFASTDPHGLRRRLADSDCFCRDTAVGKLYHRKQASFREISPTDSLHVTVGDDGLVTTHVDRHSPLARRQRGGTCRYSLLRVAAHNVSGMAGDLTRLALGTRAPGRHDTTELTDDRAVAESVASRERAGATRSSSPRPPTSERTYSVPDISSKEGKRAIESRLAGRAGVERVEVELATRTVVVAGPIGPDNVRRAIREAGYHVGGAG